VSRPKPLKCPMCNELLEFEDNFQKGDIIYCPDCDEELKLVRLDPPKLKRIVEILEVYKSDFNDPEHEYSESYEETFEEMFGPINEDIYSGEF
jgi:lysine biosynthesis protein LysW